MGSALSIPVADLVVDTENPRLAEREISQREALRMLAESQGPKLVALARDVIAYGLNPSDLPIVIAAKDSRYAVLEGNRRLTALRALENPDLLENAVKASVLRQFKKLHKRYVDNPIESIICWVVDNREEANHWIELRHTGENKGAGVVRWGSDENARHRSRTKKPEIHTQALDYLQNQDVIDNAYRKRVPSTSLKRLLGTPAVRKRLGVDVEAGNLLRMADTASVSRALKYVVDDLVEKRVTTKDIYLSHQRANYAKALPARVAVKATKKRGEGVPLTQTEDAASKASPKKRRRKPPRRFLIPTTCVLNIHSERIQQMESELRRLSLERHPNAICVLLRVFLELSADDYIKRHNLTLKNNRPPLNQKFTAVVDDLLKNKKLDKQQAAPVRKACQKGSFLAPSITLMHQYVHNQYIFPVGTELRAHWDSLQPFVEAIWSP